MTQSMAEPGEEFGGGNPQSSAQRTPEPVFRRGDRVVPSGAGRTAAWEARPGTVLRKLTQRSVEVRWDGTSFGDEMGLDELRLLSSAGEVRA